MARSPSTGRRAERPKARAVPPPRAPMPAPAAETAPAARGSTPRPGTDARAGPCQSAPPPARQPARRSRNRGRIAIRGAPEPGRWGAWARAWARASAPLLVAKIRELAPERRPAYARPSRALEPLAVRCIGDAIMKLRTLTTLLTLAGATFTPL